MNAGWAFIAHNYFLLQYISLLIYKVKLLDHLIGSIHQSFEGVLSTTGLGLNQNRSVQENKYTLFLINNSIKNQGVNYWNQKFT